VSNLVIPLLNEPAVFAAGHQPASMMAALRIMRDDQPSLLVGVEEFTEDDPAYHNDRARRAVLILTGIHIVLSGEVTLFDLDDDTIKMVLEDMEES
jgi:hypothetical protein